MITSDKKNFKINQNYNFETSIQLNTILFYKDKKINKKDFLFLINNTSIENLLQIKQNMEKLNNKRIF